MANPPLSCMCQ